MGSETLSNTTTSTPAKNPKHEILHTRSTSHGRVCVKSPVDRIAVAFPLLSLEDREKLSGIGLTTGDVGFTS